MILQNPKLKMLVKTKPANQELMNLGPNQKLILNGSPVEIHETVDGGLEITGDEFMNELLRLGFRQGRNNSPERIAEILKNVPPEHRQAFLDGVTDSQQTHRAEEKL